MKPIDINRPRLVYVPGYSYYYGANNKLHTELHYIFLTGGDIDPDDKTIRFDTINRNQYLYVRNHHRLKDDVHSFPKYWKLCCEMQYDAIGNPIVPEFYFTPQKKYIKVSCKYKQRDLTFKFYSIDSCRKFFREYKKLLKIRKFRETYYKHNKQVIKSLKKQLCKYILEHVLQ